MKLPHPLILLLLALAGGGTAMATAPSSRRRRSLRPRRWQGGQPSSGGSGSPRRSSRDPTWRPIAPLLVKRKMHAMASVPGGKVYAIGGYYYCTIASVSGYDPATNAWAAAPSLGTARSGLAAAVLDGTLYAGSREVASTTPSLQRLQQLGVPVLYLTNGGGSVESLKAEQLTKKVSRARGCRSASWPNPGGSANALF